MPFITPQYKLSCGSLHSSQRVAWGIKFRVSIGAVLSVTDVSSDVYMVWKYLSKDYESRGESEGMDDLRFFAHTTLSMILFCIVLQLIFIVVQYKKEPWSLPLESMYVMVGAKPVVDAYRVSSGEERRGNTPFDTLAER